MVNMNKLIIFLAAVLFNANAGTLYLTNKESFERALESKEECWIVAPLSDSFETEIFKELVDGWAPLDVEGYQELLHNAKFSVVYMEVQRDFPNQPLEAWVMEKGFSMGLTARAANELSKEFLVKYPFPTGIYKQLIVHVQP
jgi:hypothetical protein